MFRGLTIRLDRPAADRTGHVVAIMGPSGSGKTTLLRLICDVERPIRGTLTLEPSQASVSYLQQEPVLFEHLSRRDNARYFANVHQTRGRFDESTFQHVAAKLRLTEIVKSQRGIDEMSGGERQRLSLLRALSIRPDILLLDEPCTGLDVDVKLEFIHMLRGVVDDLHLLALYVTHHADEADLVADELLYLSHESMTSEVTARLFPIQGAIQSPPSPQAALGSMGSGGNLVACCVNSAGAIIAGSDNVLGQIIDTEVRPGRYIVVFPPETIRWDFVIDRGVKRVGQSARYSFVTAPEIDKLIGPNSLSDPKSFYLDGDAFIFPENAGPGLRVTITGARDQTSANKKRSIVPDGT